MAEKTSIIVSAFDQHILQRRITSACLGNIARYTDREDYELIFVDQGNPCDLNKRFHHIDIDKHIKIPENLGCSGAMNLGAKNVSSDTKYLCFLHNDVFVYENWLVVLRSVLEDGQYSVVMPHQGADTRDFVKKSYESDTFYIPGNDDAGLVMMTRETFQETGGWDERFKKLFMDRAFRLRFPSGYYCTAKCIITHLCGVTFYPFGTQTNEINDAFTEESAIINSPEEMAKKINYL